MAARHPLLTADTFPRSAGWGEQSVPQPRITFMTAVRNPPGSICTALGNAALQE